MPSARTPARTPARKPLPSLRRQLSTMGFRLVEPEVLRLDLHADFSWTLVEGEEEPWSPRTNRLDMFLASPGFAVVHDALFQRSRFPFAAYRSRRMGAHPAGKFAEGLSAVRREAGGRFLYNAAIKLRMSRFAELLRKMRTAAGLFDALYIDKLADFVWIHEGPWVFMFLAAERGMTGDEILRQIRESPELESQTRSWRLEKPMDAKLVDAFLAVYARKRAT
jgi:hypothetical protein